MQNCRKFSKQSRHRTNVNSARYSQQVLGDGLLPDVRTRRQRYPYGTPSHSAKNTPWRYVTFIELPNMWPDNSDIKTVDYAVLGAIVTVYRR